uniref:NADH-ubiquinone oxidoreductase chain 6 n=1 Tax=Podagrica fuscicornis TaxID=1425595 RepID=A0A1P8NMQ4_9CUCU|nr:NADH dehydrogenase subunit 6 [Podagrica fuscicornis]
MLLFLLISFSLIMVFLKHPLAYGMNLLIQTILISIISGMMTLNYWYSYIMFLIMIGGMLILFIYMTSIASNEKFKFNTLLIFMIMGMILISTILMFIDYFYFSNNFFIPESFNNKINMAFSFNKYLNFPNNMILFMIILYLFITLIAIVKITMIYYGPLRQMF